MRLNYGQLTVVWQEDEFHLRGEWIRHEVSKVGATVQGSGRYPIWCMIVPGFTFEHYLKTV